MSAGQPVEPSWCVKTNHDDSDVGIHVSQQLRVGDRYRARGEVMVCLQKGGGGQTRVLVNAAHMTSATVDLSVADARRLRDHLDRLIRLEEMAQQQP